MLKGPLPPPVELSCCHFIPWRLSSLFTKRARTFAIWFSVQKTLHIFAIQPAFSEVLFSIKTIPSDPPFFPPPSCNSFLELCFAVKLLFLNVPFVRLLFVKNLCHDCDTPCFPFSCFFFGFFGGLGLLWSFLAFSFVDFLPPLLTFTGTSGSSLTPGSLFFLPARDFLKRPLPPLFLHSFPGVLSSLGG